MNKIQILTLCLLCSLQMQAQSDKKDIVKLNQAGIELFQHLAKHNPQTNVFISPYSISSAMAMAYNGAQKSTLEEIQNTLYFNAHLDKNNELYKTLNEILLAQNAKNELLLSNALWVEQSYPIEKDFTSNLSEYFNVDSKSIAVKSAKDRTYSSEKINAWVAQNTHGKIENIITPQALSEDTRLILTNAIYFKGTWEFAFAKNATRNNYFTNKNGIKSEQEFMNKQSQFPFYEEEDFKIIEIPYANKEFSFIGILPSEKNNISNLENSINTSSLNVLLTQLNEKKVRVAIPKLSNTFETKLKDPYIQLGMPTPFTNEANFTGINPKNELKIDQVYHKTFFTMNEEGSEAAAASAVVIGTKSAVINSNEFIANKPFLYLIKENRTGLILFIGRQVNF